MKLIQLTIIIILTVLQAYAQREIKKADHWVDKKEFYKAIDLYLYAYEKKPILETAQKLADCYRHINDYKAAEIWYEKVLSYIGFEFSSFYFYAETLQKNGKYAKARQFYLLYGEVVPADATMALKLAEACASLLKSEECVIAGTTLNQHKQQLTGVIIKIIETDTSAKIVNEFISDEQGRFYIKVNKGDTFVINGMRNNFVEQNLQISPGIYNKDTIEVELVFEQEPLFSTILKSKEFKANNIYYDLDRSDIRQDASIELDKIIMIMLDNENIRVEMGAHTDSRASDEYNFELSHLRAKSAVDYLISKGVDKARISAIGYGKTQLINDCREGVPCTEKEHQVNRRMEIKLIIEQNIPAKYTNNEAAEETKG